MWLRLERTDACPDTFPSDELNLSFSFRFLQDSIGEPVKKKIKKIMGYLYLPFLFTSRRLTEQRSMGQIYFYKDEHACRELRFSKRFFGEEKSV